MCLGTISARSLAADSDQDGIEDGADGLPCDTRASGLIFAPGQGQHGLVLFEDQWPRRGDLDFNDVVLGYHYVFAVDSQARVTSLRLTINVLALGGIYNNGLGLHLPVHTDSVRTVTRAMGAQAPVLLNPVSSESELTLNIMSNLRELFQYREAQINSLPEAKSRPTQPLLVEITFSEPIAMDTGRAPFDLYIFRTEEPSFEVHRPEYHGTGDIDPGLFGSYDDGSSAERRFVDTRGIPFVLYLPELTSWPKEADPIYNLFPQLLSFAASGGTQQQDFYLHPTAIGHAYAPPPGSPWPRPSFLGASGQWNQTACEPSWGLGQSFGRHRKRFIETAAIDPQGDWVVAGSVRGALPSFASQGGEDIFVAKFDGQSGAQLWTRQLGSPGDDRARGLVVDTSGEVYLAGQVGAGLLGQAYGGDSDGLLLKLSASGELQWARLMGGPGQDIAQALALDPSGDVFVAGSIESKGAKDAKNQDLSTAFVSRYSPWGTPLWTMALRPDADSANNQSRALGLVLDPLSDTLVVVGGELRVRGEIPTGENQFVAGLSTQSPKVLWVQHIGEYGYRRGQADSRYGFAQTAGIDPSSGAIYVAGAWFGGSSNTRWGVWQRNPGDDSADATLTKLDRSGKVIWTHSIASPDGADELPQSVWVDDARGLVYLLGRTEGTLPRQSNRGGHDVFLSAFDTEGMHSWTVQQGSSLDDWPLGGGLLTGPAGKEPRIAIVSESIGTLGSGDEGLLTVGLSWREGQSGTMVEELLGQQLAWQPGPWSACSAACGGGKQTREATCRNQTLRGVQDKLCPEPKPSCEMLCNRQPCPSYGWVVEKESLSAVGCSKAQPCERVYCERSDGVRVQESFCEGSAKPLAQPACL